MSRNTYFKDELEFLNDVRDRAASEHWEIARFLADRGSDPDVERLFEGFAFLTGRLRQKLDDEFPELIQSMLSMWWPHYLRPVPSMAILEFSPVLAAFSDSKTIAAGTEVQSKPVDDSRCRFRTTRDAILHPVSLNTVGLEDIGGGAELTIDLSIWPNASFGQQTRDRIVLYLGDKHERACDLYRYLIEHTESVDITLSKDDEEVARIFLEPDAIRPVGFAGSERALPDTDSVTPGHLRLQEYFSFPEEYLFVEIVGLSAAVGQIEDTHAENMRITIRMRRQLDWDYTRARDIVRLNCVPIVNIFEGAVKPIILDNTRTEYELIAESTNGMHCELYAVDQVFGFTQQADEPREFFPFESFEHHRGDNHAPYYHLRHLPRAFGDEILTTIAFTDSSEDGSGRSTETISLGVQSTNGDRPKSLGPGDICVSTSTSPEFANFKNITRPTWYLPPPLDRGLLWRLISNISLNYTTMLETEALRTVIETYDFRGRVDRPAGRRTERVLASLQVDQSVPADRLVKGLPVRGIATQLSVSAAVFQSPGEAYLLGCVLREFLASFAGINSFHQLSFRDRDSDEVFEWPASQGSGQIL